MSPHFFAFAKLWRQTGLRIPALLLTSWGSIILLLRACFFVDKRGKIIPTASRTLVRILWENVSSTTEGKLHKGHRPCLFSSWLCSYYALHSSALNEFAEWTLCGKNSAQCRVSSRRSTNGSFYYVHFAKEETHLGRCAQMCSVLIQITRILSFTLQYGSQSRRCHFNLSQSAHWQRDIP